MELYFSPLACSMATRISLYEAEATATFIEVDTKAKRIVDGGSYLEVNALGLVPALRTDNGELLTENAAILQYVADAFPHAKLAPADGLGRVRLQQWLCFIGTELHTSLFGALLDRSAPAAMKEYIIHKGRERLTYLERHLAQREQLLDAFSVADAYLTTVLNWSQTTALPLTGWPALEAYLQRNLRRPSVARALTEEIALYKRQIERRKVA